MEEHIPFEKTRRRSGQQHLWIFVILLQLKKKEIEWGTSNSDF